MQAHQAHRNTANALADVDNALRAGIERLTSVDAEYWTFRGKSRSDYDRSPYQYPAMMVPALQRELIKLVLELQPEVSTIVDPFVGSGTVLCESMLSGRDFIGQDINPLAVLISRMRHSALDIDELNAAVKRTLEYSGKDTSDSYAVSFKNQGKWFNKGVSIGLSRIRRAIQREKNHKNRLFLWVVLAETARLNSNSRTSTYKLHIRPSDECTSSLQDVTTAFADIAANNLKIVSEFHLTLDAKGYVRGKQFKGSVAICLGDSTVALPTLGEQRAHLVMSSPPYGDNKTTVPYGQAAWLPLQWIDGDDISTQDRIHELLQSTHQIDSRSLGGRSTKKLQQQKIADLSSRSASFHATLEILKRFPEDGTQRFVDFIYDLDKVLKNTADACATNAYTIWTLGHRRIRTVECPLTDIISELSRNRSIVEVQRIQREIPSKRMANRNSISSTMRQETILILRKSVA